MPDPAAAVSPVPAGVSRLITRADADFPRHSEGDVIALPDGRLFLCYGRKAGHTDFARGTLVGLFSNDGGLTWDEASLTGPNEESAWVEWEHPWIPEAAGDHVLVTRATDSRGRTQPDTAPDNEDGYLFWATVRRPVTVAAASSPAGTPGRPAPVG